MSREMPGIPKMQDNFVLGYSPSYTVTIADDSVGEITPPREGGFASIVCDGDTSVPRQGDSALIFYDVGSSLAIVEGNFDTIGTNLVVSTSDVTGTTGVDGNTTVAVQTDVIKIENRTNATRAYQVTFM